MSSEANNELKGKLALITGASGGHVHPHQHIIAGTYY